MAFEKLDTIDYWMQFFMATDPNLPMSLIQEKAYNAVIASMSLREKIRNTDPNSIKTFDTSANVLQGSKQAALEENKNTADSQEPASNPMFKDGFIKLTPDMLQIKDQEELNQAIVDNDNGLRCAICLKRFPNLRNHLKRKHRISTEDYIDMCNYPKDTDLRNKRLIESTKARTEKALLTRMSKKEPVQTENMPFAEGNPTQNG